MPEYTYEIKLNSQQALLVTRALDFWARCSAGQLSELSLQFKNAETHYVEVDYHILQLKKLLFPNFENYQCNFDQPKTKEALNIVRAIESCYYNTEHPIEKKDPMDGSFTGSRYEGPYEDWWIDKPAEVSAWVSAGGEEPEDCSILSVDSDKHNWTFNSYRCEWICEHGVGHYDPALVENTVHGCDGCCSRKDFPGNPANNLGKDGKW
jgi:hypothetical protein